MSFGANDLSDLWIKNNIDEVRAKTRKYEARYFGSVKHKTSFMLGVKRVLDIHKKVLEIWKEAAKQPTTADNRSGRTIERDKDFIQKIIDLYKADSDSGSFSEAVGFLCEQHLKGQK